MPFNYRTSITQDRLKELLSYDPDTGLFTAKSNRGGTARKGSIAGSVKMRGYVLIGLDGVDYLAHRLAWLYMTGNWPTEEIDHRDGNPSNNRWDNLREANRSENLMNCRAHRSNTSGYRGVCWDRIHQKWVADICFYGRRIRIGTYRTKEAAARAYAEASALYHGAYGRVE